MKPRWRRAATVIGWVGFILLAMSADSLPLPMMLAIGGAAIAGLVLGGGLDGRA